MLDKLIMDVADEGTTKENIRSLEETLLSNHRIDPNLYLEYDVKRGLRDSDGKGVLTGLTEVSDVCSYTSENGERVPAEGELYYQGINVYDIIEGVQGKRYGFEETIYLLIFGKLPTEKEFQMF